MQSSDEYKGRLRHKANMEGRSVDQQDDAAFTAHADGPNPADVSF